jgi:anti-sigma regulatory factor (Ser/Thr protein kinase)
VHDGLLYCNRDEYVEGVLAFVQPALLAGDPVFVAVPGANAELLRSRLPAAADVQFDDMTVVGRNPARIIPAIQRFCDAHPWRRVRFVGEPIWPGRTPAEISEATRHEAMLNTVFGDQPVDILCPYDVSALDSSTVADAWRTHPSVVDDTGRSESPHYADPASMYDGADLLLPLPPADAVTLEIRDAALPGLRDAVRSYAADVGLSPERSRDLVIATNEVATNTVIHTAGTGTLQIWRDPDRVICEISDSGHLTDFLAGRHRPSIDAPRGRGLWMANHLCDLVQIRSTEAGTVVRLHIQLSDS